MKCKCGHGLAMHVHKPTDGDRLHGITEPQMRWCRRKTCQCMSFKGEHVGEVGYVEPVVETEKPYTTVYTDGSSTGAWGVGGWGWAAVSGPHEGREAHGGDQWTTNQRMELLAAHEAVKALDGLLLIVSDSQYVVRCFTEGWHEKWVSKGWDKVANADLWQPFIRDVHARNGEVRFAWVKGHQGMPGNERADELARRGKSEQDPRLI